MSRDNLQEIVDSIRLELAKPFGCLHFELDLKALGIDDPILLDIVPDGVSWLVTMKCAGRALIGENGAPYCADASAFRRDLYVIFRAAIRTLRTPQPKAN